MAAQVTGSKTVTRDVSPNATAAVLTAVLATPVENLTVAQLQMLENAGDGEKKMKFGPAIPHFDQRALECADAE